MGEGGRGCLRCRLPIRESAQLGQHLKYGNILASSKRSPSLPKGSEFGEKSSGIKIPVYFVSFSCA